MRTKRFIELTLKVFHDNGNMEEAVQNMLWMDTNSKRFNDFNFLVGMFVGLVLGALAFYFSFK